MSSEILNFHSEDPIPLLDLEKFSLKALQDHSAKVDEFLGFNYTSAEQSLELESPHENKNFRTKFPQELWQGTDPQIFQTPYCELRWILHNLNIAPQNRIVDLGCGYARLAHVIERHYPDLDFLGLELSKHRIEEATRVFESCYSKKLNIKNFDLNSELKEYENLEALQQAKYFFIYDFGSQSALEKCLSHLKFFALTRSIVLIARGKLIQHLVLNQHPWLWAGPLPQHYRNFSFFFSSSKSRDEN